MLVTVGVAVCVFVGAGVGVSVGFVIDSDGVTVLDSEAVPAPLLFTALIRTCTCTSLVEKYTYVPSGRPPQLIRARVLQLTSFHP